MMDEAQVYVYSWLGLEEYFGREKFLFTLIFLLLQGAAWCRWWSCVRLTNNYSRIENGKDQQLRNEWINIYRIFLALWVPKITTNFEMKTFVHTLLAFVKMQANFEKWNFLSGISLWKTTNFLGSQRFFWKTSFRIERLHLDAAKNPGNHELVVSVNKGLSFIIRVFSKVRTTRHHE